MRNFSAPIYFVVCLLSLVFLSGLALGYRKHSLLGHFEGFVRTAVGDLIRNPLTIINRYDTQPGFVDYQDFIDDGYLLISGYFLDEERIEIRLIDLSDKAVVKSWYPDPSAIREASKYERFQTVNRFMPEHPYLLADGGLVFIDNEGPLVRIDACSNIQWIVDGRFHHSIERDLDNNFIVPGVADGFNSWPMKFRDDAVVLVDVDGQVIGRHSVAQMLLDNGYVGFINTVYPRDTDPIHLNDVEVASTTTAHWHRGDWLLSLRELNMVFIYRPDTGEITWLEVGPWLKQHDPDFHDNGTISVFGNNVIGDQLKLVSGHSEIYVWTPGKANVETPYTSVLANNRVGTPTQGRAQILPNGDVFIEETDYGRILRVSPHGLVWSYYNSDGKASGVLNWSRYLPKGSLDNINLLTECKVREGRDD